MFQCDWCDGNIEDGCKIYIVNEGTVINGEGNNLEMNDEKSIYCSYECLVLNLDPC